MIGNQEILGFLRQNKQELYEGFSVKCIGLFGSVLHGSEATAGDLDILVEFEEPTSDKYMDLKFFLEDHLGMTVDTLCWLIR